MFPKRGTDEARYKHEHYSAAIIRGPLKQVIEEHPTNATNYDLKAEDIAALVEGKEARQGIFWKDIISSQLDADRMDYLLRDSLHAGVGYGRFDLPRIGATIMAIPGGRGKSPKLGVEDGGWHAAEALVVARYLMFTQVYFHKTRIAYDIHIRETLKELLPKSEFPPPVPDQLNDFLAWDDWKVLGHLSEGRGGEHGERLKTRNHYRRVYETVEVCGAEDLKRLGEAKEKLGNLVVAEESAASSWYKLGKPDIAIADKHSLDKEGAVVPLSQKSKVIENMKSNNQVLLYARPEDAEAAKAKLNRR